MDIEDVYRGLLVSDWNHDLFVVTRLMDKNKWGHFDTVELAFVNQPNKSRKTKKTTMINLTYRYTKAIP